jgi:hypothetical protein
MIGYDHVNTAKELLAELYRVFRVTDERYFPLRVRAVDLSLVIGLKLGLR